MNNWFKEIFKGGGNTKSKDPNDFTRCSLSTRWGTDFYHCPQCLNDVSHDEHISGVCDNCGFNEPFGIYNSGVRVWRKIKVKEVWWYQVKYMDSTQHLMKGWYPKNTQLKYYNFIEFKAGDPSPLEPTPLKENEE